MGLKVKPFYALSIVAFFGLCFLGPLAGCGSGNSTSERALAGEGDTQGTIVSGGECETDADCEALYEIANTLCNEEDGICYIFCDTDADCSGLDVPSHCEAFDGFCYSNE